MPNYAREVVCPKCRARKGRVCLKPDGRAYDRFHVERIRLAKRENRRWIRRGEVKLGRFTITVWRDARKEGGND